MNNKKIEKTAALVLTAVFLLSLIPILGIAVYDHPCADDFSYGWMARRAWVESGSFLAALQAGAAKVAERYQNWQGTFSSIFLMSLQPAVFGEGFYVLTPFIMLFMLSFGTLCLLKEILLGYLNCTKSQFAIISMGLLLASVQMMLSPVEGIYWFNGAVHYVFMYGCMLLLMAALLHYLRRKNAVFLILACLLALVVGGGNYVTALTAILLECITVGFLLVYGKGKEALRPLAVMACSAAGLIISGLAPGNGVRQTNFEKMSIPETVLRSFLDALRFARDHTGILYILLLLFLVPFILRMVSGCGVRFRLPLLVPVISYCLVSAMFAPTEYTMGVSYVGRTGNVILLMIQLLGILNEVYLLGWLVQGREGGPGVKALGNEEKGGRLLGFCILLALLSLAFVLGTYRSRNYTSVTAILSWRSGELAAYDAQMRRRLEVLEDDSQEKVKLAPLEHRPYLLYFDDITEQKKDWRNTSMAKYYDKKWVKLE